MQKVTIAEVSLIPSTHPDLRGVSVRDIINRNTVATHRGMLSIAEFDPGGVHELHRHPASAQISHLLSGRGEHLTENGPVPIKAGDTTYVPKNIWHGFRNSGRETAALLSIYNPAAQLSEAGYESFVGTVDRSAVPSVAMTSLSKLQGDADLDEAAGFV